MRIRMESEVPGWDRGWRLSPKRWDWARSIRCLLVGHRWQVNSRQTQRSCPRCWMVQDRPASPDPWQVHFDQTGHSCGQIGGFFHCPACGWTHGTDPRATQPGKGDA